MQIKVRNGNVEAALRVFKKKCSEKLYDLKQKQYYEKPSAKKNARKKAAIKREQKRIKDGRH